MVTCFDVLSVSHALTASEQSIRDVGRFGGQAERHVNRLLHSPADCSLAIVGPLATITAVCLRRLDIQGDMQEDFRFVEVPDSCGEAIADSSPHAAKTHRTRRFGNFDGISMTHQHRRLCALGKVSQADRSADSVAATFR
jgi:hypothetical protein